MDFELTTKHHEKLLGRTVVKGLVSFSGATPSNAQVAEELAKELKTSKDLIQMRQVKGEFGKTSATLWAYAYDSAETMKSFMPKVKAKPGAKKEEAKAGA